jgi:hypothetical protein
LVSLNLLPPGAANGIDTPYAYVGFWYNGTTGPFMVRCATADIALVNGLSAVTPQNARAVTANTGLTTAATVPLNLQAPTKNASTNGPFWCAVS